MKLFFGGGLNETGTPHPAEAAYESQNFDLRRDQYSLFPRKPFDLKSTAPNGQDIRGLMQLIKRSGVETTLVQAGPDVYRWSGSTWTSMGTVVTSSRLRAAYWSLDDYLVVSDLEKQTEVSTWDGASFVTLTTGLSTALYAKYAITHRGRVWLFNVKAGADTPHLLVASEYENPTSYDTTKRAGDNSFTAGTEAFYMVTPDLRPINGVILFQGDLIISTERGRLFRLTGADSSDYAFEDFYTRSNVISDEAFCEVGNDVMYVREGGVVESLAATDKYGDVGADDVSAQVVNVARTLTSPIAVYDQTTQRVLFFQTGKVLVFFKDIALTGAVIDDQATRAALSPWSLYTTEHPSNFSTRAAAFMRLPGTTTYTVLFGDAQGRVFDLNGEGAGDGGVNDITVIRKTRSFDVPNAVRHITRGNVRYRRKDQTNFSMTFDWGDEYAQSTVSMVLKGKTANDVGPYFGAGVYFGGSNYFNGGFSFADRVSHQNWSAVGKARTMIVTLSATSAADYEVLNVELQ